MFGKMVFFPSLLLTFFRSVSDIRKGEEIAINYSWHQVSMKSRKDRNDFLLSNWGFSCRCDICLEEESSPEDSNEKYEQFEKLKIKTKNLQKVLKTPGSFRLELIKKEVACHKEMYKLALDKRASLAFIGKLTLLANISRQEFVLKLFQVFRINH